MSSAGRAFEAALGEFFPHFPPAPPSWDVGGYTTWLHDALDMLREAQRRIAEFVLRQELLQILTHPTTSKDAWNT